MYKTICVSGQAAAAKDELVNYFVKVMNKTEPWVKTGFAKSVKDIFCDTFGVDHDFIEKWKRIPEPPPGFLKPVRQSLQFIGDGFRQISSGVWRDIVYNKMKCHTAILDGRYFNEAQKVKESGGISILLWRPGYENDDPNPSEAQLRPLIDWYRSIYDGREGYLWNDISPPDNMPELRLYDLFIVNNRTLDDLFHKVDTIIIPYLNDFYNKKENDTNNK